MTFDNDFGYSFPFSFPSKKKREEEGEWIAKIVILSARINEISSKKVRFFYKELILYFQYISKLLSSRITSHGWGHWPRTTAPRSHFYLTPGNQTTSLLNCTVFIIKDHCTRYKLRLFGAKAFPYFSPFDVYHRTRLAGSLLNVFGMTQKRNFTWLNMNICELCISGR